MRTILVLIIIFFGLLTGSFLNVLIHRLPRKESVALPPSRCPACGRRLRVGDLVPVLSYIILLGRCRHCRIPISPRYPLVELLSVGIFLLLYLHFGLSTSLIVHLFLQLLLLVIAFIDLEHRRVPNILIVIGFAFGLCFQLFFSQHGWGQALAGMFLGGGIFLLIIVISRGGMGAGDMKLMALVGFYLGLADTLMVIFFAFVFGGLSSIVLLLLKQRSRRDYLPFAPFIALAVFVTLFWGREVWTWYLSLARLY
ncbi:MAG: prepilin peptidase [Dethiobacteria bacterium]|jgi:leader peptidase (prepilin peptidase)/N-methyltransferase